VRNKGRIKHRNAGSNKGFVLKFDEVKIANFPNFILLYLYQYFCLFEESSSWNTLTFSETIMISLL
jgi:hypothetical protein